MSLAGGFDKRSYAQWREAVERELAGAPFDKRLVARSEDDLQLLPLYGPWSLCAAEMDQVPGEEPFVRGSTPLGIWANWDICAEYGCAEYACSDSAAVRRALREDVEGGVTAIRLCLAPVGEKSGQGMALASLEDLLGLFDGLDLRKVSVRLTPGESFVSSAALLAASWDRCGVKSNEARGAFGADPLAVLAREGQLAVPLEQALDRLGALARWTDARFPQVTAVEVGAHAYHDAGATPVQELAFALATGVAYLRALERAGLSIERAARQLEFSLSVGTKVFQEIAKLRAFRLVWAQLCKACGVHSDEGPRLLARSSMRMMTQYDPWVNLLRNTAATFSAAVAGIPTITVIPFDAAVGESDSLARRMARNTPIILRDEGQLCRSIDPAGGSFLVESLTRELAAAAWKLFQSIEAQGGMGAALASGFVAEQIQSANARRRSDLGRGKLPITGVSEFPNVDEEPLVRTKFSAAASASTTFEQSPGRKGTLQKSAWKAELQRYEELSREPNLSHDLLDAALEAVKAGCPRTELDAAFASEGGSEGETAKAPRLALERDAAGFERLRSASDRWRKAKGSRPRVFLANVGPIAEHGARATYSRSFFQSGGFEVVSGAGSTSAEEIEGAFRDSNADVAVICSSDRLYPDHVPAVAQRLKQTAKTVVLAGRPGPHESTWREAGVNQFIFLGCDVLGTLSDLLERLGVLA